MLIFGDKLGGVLLAVYLIVSTLVAHAPVFMKGQQAILQIAPQVHLYLNSARLSCDASRIFFRFYGRQLPKKEP